MNSHFLGGVAAPVFFGSVSPSSAAIVGVTFTGTLPRTLIGLAPGLQRKADGYIG